MAEKWTAKFSRALWGITQSAARTGVSLADFRDRAHAAGEFPDAATLSHLYATAVGGVATQRREAEYRGTVDEATYLGRRPGGPNIAPLPKGFKLTGNWRQVVLVSGIDSRTGLPAAQYMNVQLPYLVSRGEAIETAVGTVEAGPYPFVPGTAEGEYVTTWRRG